MATRPQFDDSEHIQKEIKLEPETKASGPLTKDELALLREFLLLLDKWEKSGGRQ